MSYRQFTSLDDGQINHLISEFITQSEALPATRSLSWYNSHIQKWDYPLRIGEPVIVVELGGTFIRTAVGTSHDGNTVQWLIPIRSQIAQNKHKHAQDFIHWIGSIYMSLLQQYPSSRFGFIFSYPHQSVPTDKGSTAILTSVTKALQVPDVVGLNVAQSVVDLIESAGHPVDQFITLNDSVAATVSVRQAPIGVVVGTGGNLASIHPSSPHLHNLEAGNFDALEHTQASALIDLEEHTGKQTLEKQTTGRYLHRLLVNQMVLQDLDLQLVRHVVQKSHQNASLTVETIASGDLSSLSNQPLPESISQIIVRSANTLLTTSAQAWAALTIAAMQLNYPEPQSQSIPIAITGGVALRSSIFWSSYVETLKKHSRHQILATPVQEPLSGAVIVALKT